jgi:prepilin-type N-terminal cleavage/methylation domain-containing protein
VPPTLDAMVALRLAGGFALPELLVAVAILGFVLAGVFGLVKFGVATYVTGVARVEAQQSARVGLERMVRELREAGYDPTGAGVAPILTAAVDRVTFQRDLNKNGVVDATSERVTFLLRPGESILRRDAGAGAQPIVQGVRRLTLTYFDRAGAPTVDPALVASIHISLAVGLAGPESLVESQVTLRNYRDP